VQPDRIVRIVQGSSALREVRASVWARSRVDPHWRQKQSLHSSIRPRKTAAADYVQERGPQHQAILTEYPVRTRPSR
jgi:hypothetical protein